jgi:hypothetical protein
MQRRKFICATGGLIASSHSLAWSTTQNYAESVAMTGHSTDGNTTFDVRIARLPDRMQSTLWMYAYVDDIQYSLIEHVPSLAHSGRTHIEAKDAEFTFTGHSHAQLLGRDRFSAAMTGYLKAQGNTHQTPHPDPGPGTLPLQIEARFQASHTPINVRAGAWGYRFHNNQINMLKTIDIDPYGPPIRQFSARLADGAELSGAAHVVREVSVPIEGQRRPGATVVVHSNLGRMVGVLNDWMPA